MLRGRLSEEPAGRELLSGRGRRAPETAEVCAPRLVKAVATLAYVKEANKPTFSVCVLGLGVKPWRPAQRRGHAERFVGDAREPRGRGLLREHRRERTAVFSVTRARARLRLGPPDHFSSELLDDHWINKSLPPTVLRLERDNDAPFYR